MPTQLLDRPGLERALAEAPSSGPVTLALIDVDHFAAINERYGTETGDAVLRRVERALLGSLPRETSVARIGGDEYAAVFPDHTAESALILMEEVRAHLATPLDGEEPGSISLSAGLATHPAHVTERGDLVRAADEAVLRAKRDGRGRVAIHVEERMVLKSNYYSKASLGRLAKLSAAEGRTEASLLREALDALIDRYRDRI
ncbi:MAG: GGDEF domain-containing protein [Deinococcales bacterium]|jgi:diguanylate cyclase (GGDEF)-like protein